MQGASEKKNAGAGRGVVSLKRVKLKGCNEGRGGEGFCQRGGDAFGHNLIYFMLFIKFSLKFNPVYLFLFFFISLPFPSNNNCVRLGTTFEIMILSGKFHRKSIK